MDLLPPVCALTGNQTHNLSVYRAVLQPTGHTCQSMFINEREKRERQRERDRERQRDRERGRLIASHMCPDQGLNLQPRYEP